MKEEEEEEEEEDEEEEEEGDVTCESNTLLSDCDAPLSAVEGTDTAQSELAGLAVLYGFNALNSSNCRAVLSSKSPPLTTSVTPIQISSTTTCT